MAYLTIEDFEITRVICTVDFNPNFTLMDMRMRLAGVYAQEFSQMNFSDPLALRLKSLDGSKEISISINQWGYVLHLCASVEKFIPEAIDHLQKFCECSKVNTFNRIGLRIFYNFPLEDVNCTHPEFPRLSNYFNIPGIEDEKIADIIHYNVSAQQGGKRDILTFGQNYSKEENQYFLRPDLNSHDYGIITVDKVKTTLLAAYQRLISRFKKYLKGAEA